MTQQQEPVAQQASVGFGSSQALKPWAEARKALTGAQTYWLSTVRTDGRPHVAPVWAVWLNDVLYFSTGERSVKGRNLAREPRCSVSVEAGNLHLVVEGKAAKVTDEARLREMVAVYSAKYDWPMQVKDGGVVDEHGNGGPAYALQPSIVLGFVTGEAEFSATRWVFS